MSFRIVSNLNPVVVNMTGGFVGSITGNTAGTPAVISSGTQYLAGGNNITLSQSGNTVSIIGGAGGGGGGGIANAAGTQTATSGTVLFNNANNVSFGMSNNSVVTASASFNQSVQPALGLNTAFTNVTATANSSGLSIDAGGYAGTNTTFNGTNISGSMTVNSNGVNLALSGPAAGGGAGDGYNIIGVNGGATQLSSTYQFSNSNNVSFGLNLGTITASASYPAQTVQPVAASASNGSFNFSTLKFVEGSGVTWATQANGIQASVKTDYQSSNANYLTSQSNQAVSGGNGSSTFQTLSFANSNGVSFSTGTQGLYASHNGLTTARASNDAIGLNTAGTNVTWTVNSSGISLNAGAYLTTAMASNRGTDFVQATAAFAGTNASGTIASNGISVSVAAPGAAAENNWFNLIGNTGGTSTASGSTIALSGGNGVTLSGSNGSQIGIHVNTSPDQWYINGNTAGANSSYAWTNDALYLSGGANITLSQNGSTLGIIGAAGGGGGVTESAWANIDYMFNSQTQQNLQSTYGMFPLDVEYNVSFDNIQLANSVSLASSSFASTANTTFTFNQAMTMNVMLYSRGTGASSMSLQSIKSTSAGLTYSALVSYGSASNTNQGWQIGMTMPMATGTTSYSASYSTSNVSTMALSTGSMTALTGMKFLQIPFSGSLAQGEYWMGLNNSTASTTQATNLSGIRLLVSTVGLSQINNTIGMFGSSNNASIQIYPGIGSFTTVGGASTASLNFSNISSSASHIIPYVSFTRTVN